MKAKLAIHLAIVALAALLAGCAVGGHIGSVGGGIHAF